MKKYITAVLMIVGFMAVSFAYAKDDAVGGQLLAGKCQGCHDNGVYTRANRFIQDRDALHAQVSRCSKQARAGWSAQQLDSVVNYLDSQYYKF